MRPVASSGPLFDFIVASYCALVGQPEITFQLHSLSPQIAASAMLTSSAESSSTHEGSSVPDLDFHLVSACQTPDEEMAVALNVYSDSPSDCELAMWLHADNALREPRAMIASSPLHMRNKTRWATSLQTPPRYGRFEGRSPALTTHAQPLCLPCTARACSGRCSMFRRQQLHESYRP